jgi:hypothetical protein
MPLKEMAASTSAWLLTRSLGGTLGIAIFQAVITTGLESRFPKLEGYGTQFQIPHDLEGYHRIHNLPEGPTREAALFAFSDSLRVRLVHVTCVNSELTGTICPCLALVDHLDANDGRGTASESQPLPTNRAKAGC